MKRKQIIVSLTGVCTVLGLIIGVQYNTVKLQTQNTDHTRSSELSAALKQLQTEYDALQKKYEVQTKLVEEYESGVIVSAKTENLMTENERLRAFSGVAELTGKGIVITMKDSTKNMGGDPNAYVIHAEDIMQVVNELFVAGAKAVSVNGQRIVANTGITCAGSVITINGVRVAAPFEVRAIGDASVMEGALKFPGGVVDNLSPWGIGIDMKAEGNVTIPAYTQSVLWEDAIEGGDRS